MLRLHEAPSSVAPKKGLVPCLDHGCSVTVRAQCIFRQRKGPQVSQPQRTYTVQNWTVTHDITKEYLRHFGVNQENPLQQIKP